jgi:hypothetical protein
MYVCMYFIIRLLFFAKYLTFLIIQQQCMFYDKFISVKLIITGGEKLVLLFTRQRSLPNNFANSKIQK